MNAATTTPPPDTLTCTYSEFLPLRLRLLAEGKRISELTMLPGRYRFKVTGPQEKQAELPIGQVEDIGMIPHPPR